MLCLEIFFPSSRLSWLLSSCVNPDCILSVSFPLTVSLCSLSEKWHLVVCVCLCMYCSVYINWHDHFLIPYHGLFHFITWVNMQLISSSIGMCLILQNMYNLSRFAEQERVHTPPIEPYNTQKCGRTFCCHFDSAVGDLLKFELL